MKELRKQQVVIKEESKAIRSKGKSPVNKTFASVAKLDLQFPSIKPSQCDIRMDDVYDKIQFKNIDGGVWKQGWDVQYDKQKVLKPENKLRVFVMPHSHNDPGTGADINLYTLNGTHFKISEWLMLSLIKFIFI